MPSRKPGSREKPASQTTLFPDEPGAGNAKDAGGQEKAKGNEAGASESELASEFAERFWKMEVDKEAMRNFYAIHEHNARRLHWDLRLEKDGVLKSWAIPKEPPTVAGVKRLAVEVEDHPLGYGTYEGEIPKGSYGAGTVKIWDRGKFEPLELAEGKWVFNIDGSRLKGKYCLVRLKPRGGEKGINWLFFKAKE